MAALGSQAGRASLGPSARRARPKLRVGVFADSPLQPRWLVDSLARIAAGDFAELTLLGARERRSAPRPGSQKLATVWKAYERLDRWLFGTGPDPLQPTPVEVLAPATRRFAFRPEDRAWRARVANQRLDVVVLLGDIDPAPLEGLARYGVWQHCFGESQTAGPELAGLREVIDQEPVLASGIRIRHGGADRIACQSWSRTIPFSLARSHDRLFGKSGEFLARGLRDLHEHGEGWLERAMPAEASVSRDALPGVGETMRGIATIGARVARRTLDTCISVGQWSIAFRFTPHEPWDGNLDAFYRLTPPVDRFWADPFPISVNGRHYIFFEELPFSTGKGHISVVEVGRDGHASAPIIVLERDYHLSYPFLVEDGGELYMIPESAYDNTVQLFRCEEFPHRWKRERVLLDGLFCADATLHRERGAYGERWWMFTNIGSEAAGVDDELHIFHAKRLLGDWTPHARNPVKSDVRSSRPAGRLFVEGGELYRPGQICTPIYGSGIALHRVKELTTEEFAEEEARRIVPVAQPSAGRGARPAVGLHTINRYGDLSVIDAFVRRRRF